MVAMTVSMLRCKFTVHRYKINMMNASVMTQESVESQTLCRAYSKQSSLKRGSVEAIIPRPRSVSTNHGLLKTPENARLFEMLPTT